MYEPEEFLIFKITSIHVLTIILCGTSTYVAIINHAYCRGVNIGAALVLMLVLREYSVACPDQHNNVLLHQAIYCSHGMQGRPTV